MNLNKFLISSLFVLFLVGCGEEAPDKYTSPQTSNQSTSNDSQSTSLSKKIRPFQIDQSNPNGTCVSENVQQTMLLVDLTDELTSAQIQYVRDNFINNFSWSNQGDTFAQARITKVPPQKMTSIKMCAPETLSQNNGIMNKGRVSKFNQYRSEIYENLIMPNGVGSDKSLLIESVRSIYNNARYDFSASKGPRHLILVSDLYQNSGEISFYSCNPKDKKCSFSATKKKKKNWFEEAKLNLTSNDKVTIYYLSSKCRIDLTAKEWWKQYFLNEGVSEGNLKIISELGNNSCASPVIKEVEVPVEIIKEVPKEVIKEVEVEVIKEVPKEVIKEVEVEVVKEVPKEVIKEVEVEVVKEVQVEKSVVCPEKIHSPLNQYRLDIFCD